MVFVEAQVDTGPAGKAYEVPAVKVSWVEHGVLREEHESLYLSGVSGNKGAIGVG